MTRRRSTSTQFRGKKERILRYLLRRKPCCFITIGEIISLIVFTSLFVLSLILYLEERRTTEQYDKEDILWKRMGNHITWAHCNFEEPNEFDTKFCEKRIADESYAFKYYKRAPSEKDPTCMDIQYREKCHEDISTNITHFKQRMYKQCAGLNEVKMPHAESLDIDIKAPVFDLAGMEKIKGQFVLAQEIFLQCPRCKVRSRQFKVNEDGKDVCVVKVNTTKKGWPAFAEDCDDVIQIVHASQNCQ